MLTKFFIFIRESIENGKNSFFWKITFWFSLVLTTFVVTYLLILPAITIENNKVAENGITVSSNENSAEQKKEFQTSESSQISEETNTKSNSDSDLEEQNTEEKSKQETEPDEQSTNEVYFEGTLKERGDGYEVQVTIGKDAELPVDTNLEISELKENEANFDAYKEKALEKVSKKDNQVKNLQLIDITLKTDDGAVQPASAVKVEIIYDEPIEKIEDPKIVHFKDNGELEVLDSKVDPETIDSASDIAFKTESFSIYAIVQPDGNTEYRKTFIFENADGTPYKFKTNANTETDTQILKDGESLHGVGLPFVASGVHFNGWFIFNKETQTYGDEVHFEEPISVTKEETVYVRPSYGNVAFATFFDNAQGTVILERHQAALVDGEGSVDLSDHTAAPPSSTQIFEGWSLTKNGPVITDNLTDYRIRKDNNFYPIFREAKKIEFSTGKIDDGAPYVAPKFVIEGNSAESIKPADPIRSGYTFGGWYLDKNYQNKFDFSTKVTEDITLYARWLPATANYTVVYWQQSKTDPKNSLATDKTYDYAGQSNRTGTVDTTVSLLASDRTPAKGFTYTTARGETSTVVKADGSSIINVYFDRKLITMKFLNSQFYNFNSFTPNYNHYVWTDPNYSNLVDTYTGLYGTSLAQNGYTWPSAGAQSWKYYAASNVTRGMSYLGDFILPEDTYDTSNTEIRLFRSGEKSVNYYFYKQNIDGSYNDTPTDIGSGQMSTFTFSEKYSGFNVSWYRRYYGGTNDPFDTDWRRAANNGTTQTFYTYGNYYNVDYPLDLHILYERKQYNINFLDPLDNKELENFDPISVSYEDTIADHEPDTTTKKPIPTRPGYKWDGKWYKDQTQTQEIDWSVTMPSHDLKVYAGWEKLRYNVKIEANGGELLDTQATYFKLDYGEKISEYSNITRDYVEDPNGEYYYRHDTENGIETDGRHAHYTKNPNEPNVDKSKRYRYEKDAYKLVGWYYVNPDGTTRPYNFSGVVVGDTTLRAEWRRVGEYTINYNPQVYDFVSLKPLVDEKGNKVIAENLPVDPYAYDDQSHAELLTRPTAPSQYRFRGWYYDGKIYNPHDSIVINADLADNNKVIQVYPVFKSIDDLQVDTTEITYDGNGGNRKVQENGEEKTVTSVTIDKMLINTKLKLPEKDYFNRPGYDLVGWNENKSAADAGNAQFSFGQEVGVDNLPNTENTLYAVWQPKLYRVSISKRVIGNESDKNRTFTFTPGKELGTENFAIKDGESKVYEEVPYGSQISIDEQAYEDFSTTETITHKNRPNGDADETYDTDGTVDLTVDGNIDITFTNERNRQRLIFQKVSIENLNNSLSGAKFDLYKLNDDGTRDSTPFIKNLTSNENGYFEPNENGYLRLGIGNYEIVETKAPDGYEIEEAPIQISVKSTGISVLQNGNANPVSKNKVDDGGTVYNTKITNTSGVELPSTGGIGQHVYLILGILLAAPAAYLYILKTKQKA